MAFARRNKQSTNSVRTSVWHDAAWKRAIPVSMLADVINPAISPITQAELGYEICSFIDSFYANSPEYKAKSSYYAERALYIKKHFVGINDVLANLLAQVSGDDNAIKNIVYDIRRMAPLSVINNDKYAYTLMHGSVKEKKAVMSMVLTPKTYEALKIYKRGHKYVDAVADALLCCYHAD